MTISPRFWSEPVNCTNCNQPRGEHVMDNVGLHCPPYHCTSEEITALRDRVARLETTLSATSFMLDESLRALGDVQLQAVEGQRRDEGRIRAFTICTCGARFVAPRCPHCDNDE